MTNPILEEKIFERLFGESGYFYDLKAGTVVSHNGVRIIYLSSDIIRGIYEALYLEAGDAWKLILSNCGYRWGKQLYDGFNKELQMTHQKTLENFTINAFVEFIEHYFNLHGWGKIKVNLDDATNCGIIRVTMTHSLFVDTLNHLRDRVDFMIAGMLRGLFEKISEQNLDCLEIKCSAKGAAPSCEFVITGQRRIRLLESLIENDDPPLEKLLAQLREF
ncbi:MAG: hypothetical protein RIT27_1636 [Pseudomonadota bacterium]|jgi:predicted hydrocarbon binding protein